MVAETYLELLKDPNHLMYEITINIVENVLIGALAWPFIKKWIKRHDIKHHKHNCEEEDE